MPWRSSHQIRHASEPLLRERHRNSTLPGRRARFSCDKSVRDQEARHLIYLMRQPEVWVKPTNELTCCAMGDGKMLEVAE